MLSFGLISPHERGTIKFNRFYLKRLFEKAGLMIKVVTEHGTILPNKTPEIMLPVVRLFDGRFPFGFYTVIVGEKK